jgi:AcrR family transcriptional regulator
VTRRLLKRDERVASILAAAARAFAGGGFAATSMEDVAREAGVTKLILYRHFATKQDLYEAVLDNTRERLAEALSYRERPMGPDMLLPLIAAARADPSAFALLFRHASREPEFAHYAADFQRRMVAAAERGVGGAVADPVLRQWLSRVVLSVTLEGILAWLDLSDGDPAGDEALARRLLAAVGAIVGTLEGSAG